MPNDAHAPLINNVNGTIVLVDRGNVSFAVKVRHAQDAGAVGVVIGDDGSCSEDFECGHRLGSRMTNDFAARDLKEAWEGVRIPVVLVTRAAVERITQLLHMRYVKIDGFGMQRYVP